MEKGNCVIGEKWRSKSTYTFTQLTRAYMAYKIIEHCRVYRRRGNALIRLRRCTWWSWPSLFSYCVTVFFQRCMSNYFYFQSFETKSHRRRLMVKPNIFEYQTLRPVFSLCKLIISRQWKERMSWSDYTSILNDVWEQFTVSRFIFPHFYYPFSWKIPTST